MYKVETAGDCYIVAGALMRVDEDGFQSIDRETDAGKGAEKVMAFAKVRRWDWWGVYTRAQAAWVPGNLGFAPFGLKDDACLRHDRE